MLKSSHLEGDPPPDLPDPPPPPPPPPPPGLNPPGPSPGSPPMQGDDLRRTCMFMFFRSAPNPDSPKRYPPPPPPPPPPEGPPWESARGRRPDGLLLWGFCRWKKRYSQSQFASANTTVNLILATTRTRCLLRPARLTFACVRLLDPLLLPRRRPSCGGAPRPRPRPLLPTAGRDSSARLERGRQPERSSPLLLSAGGSSWGKSFSLPLFPLSGFVNE